VQHNPAGIDDATQAGAKLATKLDLEQRSRGDEAPRQKRGARLGDGAAGRASQGRAAKRRFQRLGDGTPDQLIDRRKLPEELVFSCSSTTASKHNTLTILDLIAA
jgi:hypothetical protein